MLSACSDGMKASTRIDEMKTSCIDGVEYIVFKEVRGNHSYGFMTVKFNRDGNIETCNN